MIEFCKNTSLLDIKGEVWHPIKGFENYSVSTFGRIKSYVNYNNARPRIKAQQLPRNGYLLVSLWKNNKEKKAIVHRLVAIAFIPKIKDKIEVNHKNGIITDNRVENLEWMTPSENQIHSYLVLKRVKPKGKKWGDSPRARTIKQFSRSGKFLRLFTSLTEASEKTNMSRSNIWHALNKNQITAGGFKWRYK